MRGATKPLILIGIPTMGEHSYMFTQSILGAVMPSNFSMQVRFVPGLEVGRARNILVQEAKNLGAKYLMFRDEDTLAPANLVPSLIFHLETKPDLTFIGGVYATKSHPPEPLVYQEWGQGPAWGWKYGDLVPVLFTGMGASLIRVSDFDQLDADEYQDRSPWDGSAMTVREYFNTGSAALVGTNGQDKTAWTEDAFFFHKLEDKGMKAMVDTSMVCGHWDRKTGTLFYPPMDSGIAAKPDAWEHSPRVVNLGAGGEYNPYEVQVDLREGPHIDFHCDIRRLPEDWADTFDVAKSHHVLEHFGFEQSQDVLTEWFRIIKPGGKIEIAVPDLQAFAEHVAAGNFDVITQGGLWGDQGHPFWMQGEYGGYDGPRWLPHSTDHNHHKSGYTARFLIDLLKRVGFVNVKAERRLGSWELFVQGEKSDAS
jgi:SAM-dependent methyltransferase